MIYKRPGFHAVVWFGSPHHQPPSRPVSKMSLFLSFPVWRRSSLRTGEGEGMGRTQITRRQESLALYKSFNTLCFCPFLHVPLSCLAKRMLYLQKSERGEGFPSYRKAPNYRCMALSVCSWIRWYSIFRWECNCIWGREHITLNNLGDGWLGC